MIAMAIKPDEPTAEEKKLDQRAGLEEAVVAERLPVTWTQLGPPYHHGLVAQAPRSQGPPSP